MSKSAAFIYEPNELLYKFYEDHPFNQKRLEMTVDLLRKADALSPDRIVPPREAAVEELEWIHTPEYIRAVQGLSAVEPETRWLSVAGRYGLDSEDTPYFAGMHEVTSQVTGGSLTAAELVMTGRAEHALHLAGGLHHAMPNRGSGFCVYNDASVAIALIRKRYGARVLYVDTDVHHGDGVQWSFYTDPEVMTLSIHETGKYLFPGTGSAAERGSSDGFGYSINVPVEPYTEDESWMDSFRDVLCAAAAQFRPDVIVSQHGCDAHAFDPLAHVHCSMNIYLQMPKLIHSLAHRYCEGRWIALGGGGYDIWRVVPRAWSLLWLTMTGHELAEAIEGQPGLALPLSWIGRWQPESPVELPSAWLDPCEFWTPMPRRAEIAEKNRQSKELAMLYLPGKD